MAEVAPLRTRSRMPRPLALSLSGMSLVAGSVACAAASHPGGHLLLGLLGLILCGAAVLCLIALGILCVVYRGGVPYLIVGIVILAGLFAVSRSDLPLQARFAAHQNEFDRVAQLPPGDQGGCPNWIGSYRITECELMDPGRSYQVETERLFGGKDGFAYLPEGPPTTTEEGVDVSYRQVAGYWYAYSISVRW